MKVFSVSTHIIAEEVCVLIDMFHCTTVFHHVDELMNNETTELDK